MKKRVIEVELFYFPDERTENSSFELSNKAKELLRSRIHRFTSVFKYDFGYEKIRSTSKIVLNKDNVIVFELKSNVIDEMEAVIEVHMLMNHKMYCKLFLVVFKNASIRCTINTNCK